MSEPISSSSHHSPLPQLPLAAEEISSRSNHAPTQSFTSYAGTAPVFSSGQKSAPALSLTSLITGGVLLVLSFVPVLGLLLHFFGPVPIVTGVVGWVTSAQSGYKRGVLFSIVGISFTMFGFFVAVASLLLVV